MWILRHFWYVHLGLTVLVLSDFSLETFLGRGVGRVWGHFLNLLIFGDCVCFFIGNVFSISLLLNLRNIFGHSFNCIIISVVFLHWHFLSSFDSFVTNFNSILRNIFYTGLSFWWFSSFCCNKLNLWLANGNIWLLLNNNLLCSYSRLSDWLINILYGLLLLNLLLSRSIIILWNRLVDSLLLDYRLLLNIRVG